MMKKIRGVLRAFVLWFLWVLVFIIVMNLIPGTTYIDDETGKSSMYSFPAIICIVGPIFLLLIRKRQRKQKQARFNKLKIDKSSVSSYENSDDRDFITEAKKAILEAGEASVTILQRKLHIRYTQAAELIDHLEDEGFVGPYTGSLRREILYKSRSYDNSLNRMQAVDSMEGHEFEHWCADLLRQNGFQDVQVTPGSGDQGVDILAEKDGIKYAIQCKCYSRDLGNTPVQEVESGRVYYGCHVGVVMTNRYFTQGAKDLAEKTGTLLWDRDFVENMSEIS